MLCNLLRAFIVGSLLACPAYAYSPPPPCPTTTGALNYSTTTNAFSCNAPTTLGTVTTGVWNGTPIINTYIAQLAGNTLTNGDWCTTNGTNISCNTSAPVTSVATNNGLTGGTITGTGTIGLASISNNGALCNNSGVSAPPTSANCTVTGTGNMVMATSPTVTGPTLSNMYITSGYAESSVYSNGNSGTSFAIQMDNGPTQSVTITGAVTITLSTPTHMGKMTIILTQDGTGHVYSISGCKWTGGTAISYSSSASAIDVISILYDGSHFYCSGGAAFS